MYMREVIRTIYPRLEPAALTLAAEERAVVAKTLPDDPAKELKRRVSRRLNSLIAELVRAFYPFWGSDISPAVVRNTLRTAKRKTKKTTA